MYCLPALQALACCETTNKSCNKNAALKESESGVIENLVIFDQTAAINVDKLIAL